MVDLSNNFKISKISSLCNTCGQLEFSSPDGANLRSEIALPDFALQLWHSQRSPSSSWTQQMVVLGCLKGIANAH